MGKSIFVIVLLIIGCVLYDVSYNVHSIIVKMVIQVVAIVLFMLAGKIKWED